MLDLFSFEGFTHYAKGLGKMKNYWFYYYGNKVVARDSCH
ncbi:hypothetical protein RV07_GL002688 [Enterococcus malodoratus]|nr:hypothetical protein RV07_GL002688 [Enterococcus malodoratus]